jgi:hypothetical protein
MANERSSREGKARTEAKTKPKLKRETLKDLALAARATKIKGGGIKFPPEYTR